MSAKTITREQVVQIATEYAQGWGIEYKGESWESGLPTVVEGAHEESDADWIISWEEAPTDGWVHDDATLQAITERVLGIGGYYEPINHFSIAFFYA